MIRIAGQVRTVDEAKAKLATYSLRTITQYDLPTSSPGPIAVEEIARTRAVSSRISRREGDWLCARSRDWDWSTIPAGAALADADPEVPGGLYDTAAHLYGYFRQGRPAGIDVAKIHKVLHIKYPALYPILDSHLMRSYRVPARAAAKASLRFAGSFRHLYWAAIRDDVLASDLSPLRNELRRDERLAVFADLSDVRLLDTLTW